MTSPKFIRSPEFLCAIATVLVERENMSVMSKLFFTAFRYYFSSLAQTFAFNVHTKLTNVEQHLFVLLSERNRFNEELKCSTAVLRLALNDSCHSTVLHCTTDCYRDDMYIILRSTGTACVHNCL